MPAGGGLRQERVSAQRFFGKPLGFLPALLCSASSLANMEALNNGKEKKVKRKGRGGKGREGKWKGREVERRKERKEERKGKGKGKGGKGKEGKGRGNKQKNQTKTPFLLFKSLFTPCNLIFPLQEIDSGP